MPKLELPPRFPEEAAQWVMEHGSGLEVKPHPQKADVWFVLQSEGLYKCSLSYNKKGNLYFYGATHIIMAIKGLLDRYFDAGRRGYFLATPETRCTVWVLADFYAIYAFAWIDAVQFDGCWPTSVVYWLHVICTLDPGRCLHYLCQEKHVLRDANCGMLGYAWYGMVVWHGIVLYGIYIYIYIYIYVYTTVMCWAVSWSMQTTLFRRWSVTSFHALSRWSIQTTSL